MNSNSSPHSRPARRPQRRPRTAGSAHDAELQSSARRSRGVTRRDATRSQRRKKTSASSTALPAAAQLTMGQRIRKVGLTLAIPHAVIIMSIIVVAVATLLMTSSSIAVLPTVIATAWLVFHAAPVAGEDVVIAAVPLLPALLTIALSARQVHASVRKRFSIIDLLMVFAWSLSTPLLLTVIALLMLADAQTVYPVAVPPIGPVLVSVLLVHLMAFVVGFRAESMAGTCAALPRSVVDYRRCRRRRENTCRAVCRGGSCWSDFACHRLGAASRDHGCLPASWNCRKTRPGAVVSGVYSECRDRCWWCAAWLGIPIWRCQRVLI